MSTLRKVTYRAGLFDPANLVTHEKINEALYEFAGVLNQANFSQVLDDVLDKSHIVELILSGLGEEIALQDWILQDFPTSTQSFDTTLSYKLMSKLSDFFLFHSSSDTVLRKHHQTVQLAPDILDALYAISLLGNAPANGSERTGVSKKSKTKSSQKEMKQAHKASRRTVINEAPFISTNIPVPHTSADAITSIANFFESLKDILKLYLIKIRTEEFCTIIRESFIPQERPAELRIITTTPAVEDEPLPPAPTTATTTTAFPIVQPLKSALYFDSPEGFGKWTILVSSGADRDLRQHRRKARASFDIIVKKIKELSNGHFSYDNQKRLSGPGTDVPIYEAKLSGDLRLVYQIDCVTGYDIETESQVLRIYGIYTHAHMDKRLWDSVSSYRSKRGGEYRNRCLQRKKQDGDVYLPICFSSLDEAEEESSSRAIPDLPPDDNNQLHQILTLEKYVTLSKELLESIEDNRDATFPFEVSKYERKIIEHPSSCYVLGRSGTGKTTTMLFKMLWVERAYRMSEDHRAKPRQIFVTQSRVLAGKVEELFASYLESLAAASHSGNVEHNTKGCNSVSKDEDLKYESDRVEYRNDLPQRFSELEDDHFPLFLTVDRLYGMIEADIEHSISDKDVEHNHNTFEVRSPPSRQPAATASGKFITFDRFLGEYWPHLTQSLKKNFNPSLVFSEFMGVIQGSECSVTSPNGCLDRRTYEDLSSRTQSTFAEHRSAIYGLFESYRKLKNEHRDFDASDRTHAILRAITKRTGILGQTFDYIYVDETQDNLLIDSLVLRLLCRNTDGLFWAGDTAQTISAGSSFRFDDLTSFLFQFEEQRRLQDAPSRSEQRKKPKKFHLAVNYRSHSGIVNCAHSVIELISKYWPYSIDILPRERGNTDGVKPIFYRDIYPGFMHEGHFLSRNKDSVEKIELGANQCILVRDEAAKQRLEKEVGKIGIILTLYDSKGLEFNDVFLYNFFHDSVVDASQWRVVLNSISTDNLLYPAFQAAPRFDPTRHAAICSELKSLYVAITRARNNLRIADESLKGEPMRVLWTNRDQIRNCQPSDDLSDFAVPSSKEEWAKRALELSRNHKYALARDSYEKAEKPHEAALENARYLQQLAVRTPTDPRNRKREVAFKKAAEAFLSCARNAMKIHTKKGHYRASAECFEQAGDDLSAAETYRLAEDFTKSSRLFRRLGRFDDVHSMIVNHGEKIEDLDSIRDVVRLYYVNKKQFDKAHQLFETLEEEIEYLEDRNLDMAQVDLLLVHGRKAEAAYLHLAEGRVLEAVDLFIEDGQHDANSSQRAIGCILQGLWLNLYVGAVNTTSFEVQDYLNRLAVLEKNTIEPTLLLELDMFQAIVSGELDKLFQLAKSFLAAGNVDAAFLCLDHCYSKQIPSLEAMGIVEIATSLELFFKYARMLHDLAFLVDSGTDPRVLKLFGVVELDDNIIISPNTVFYRSAYISTLPAGSMQYEPIRLSKNEFVLVYQSCLQERLLDRVTRENDICRRAPALYIRPYYESSTGQFSTSTSRGALISPDATWYRNWLNVHLLQILIYDSISRIQFFTQMQSERRFWIRKLHEVLNPLHHSLGSPYRTDCDTVGIHKALTVVIDWARAISFKLDCWPSSSFLTIVMQTADFAFTFDKKEASIYMYRSRFINSPDTPSVFLRKDGQHTLQELLVSFDGKGPSSLLMGILFIRHVMEKAIPVDINVFSSFIEKICTSLLLCNRYQWHRNLHGIVLPRGWMIRALKHFDPIEALQQDTKRFWLLLDPLYAIIEGLYFHQVEHLLFGHEMRSAVSQGYTIRGLYISRMCRVLGLLGTNIRVMQTAIQTRFKSLLHKPNQRFPRIYSSYIYAKSFDAIANATRRSMQGSLLDELVQLLVSQHTRYPVYDIYGLRRIVYTQQEDIDIFQLLNTLNMHSGGNPSGAYVTDPNSCSNLSMESAAFELHSLEAEEELLIDNPDALINDTADNDDDEVDQDYIPDIEIPKNVQVGHSNREVDAAFVIQRFCRRALQRLRLSKSSSLEGDIYKWSIICLQDVRYIKENAASCYRLRYLGFIPTLLGCFDGVNNLVFAYKTALKRRLKSSIGRHEELDEVSCGLTRVNYLTKSIKHCRNALLPWSDLHRRHALDELRKHVQSALDLMSDLQIPIQLPEEIKQELHRVYKGILQKPRAPLKTAKKEKRPALVMEGCTSNWEDDSEKEDEIS